MINQLKRIWILGVLFVFCISSCNLALFNADKEKKQLARSSGENQNTDDDDTNIDDPDSYDGEYTDEEINQIEVENISAKTLRTEIDGWTDGACSGKRAKITLSIYKIGNKKVPDSYSKKTEATFTYDGHNATMNNPKQHTESLGSKGLCPSDGQSVTYNIDILSPREDLSECPLEVVTSETNYVEGAKVNGAKELFVGIADTVAVDAAFHNIDSWIIKFSCPNNNKLNFKSEFSCWDKRISGNKKTKTKDKDLNPYTSELRRCWAIEGGNPNCPAANSYTKAGHYFAQQCGYKD